jgi:hypothetical protein
MEQFGEVIAEQGFFASRGTPPRPSRLGFFVDHEEIADPDNRHAEVRLRAAIGLAVVARSIAGVMGVSGKAVLMGAPGWP